MAIGEIAKVASEVAKETTKEMSKETAKLIKNLDKPLNNPEKMEKSLGGKDSFDGLMNELDKSLNSEYESKADNRGSANNETNIQRENIQNESSNKEIKKMEIMEPQIKIEFTCPEGMDKKEFARQLKAQERGLNSQTVAENMDNREKFEQRRRETGNGRDISEGKKAQDITREKATQSRIESNQKKGMSYSEAKAEAQEWIKTQAALHNPDQIAGGEAGKVSRMGDANVNSSIGSQWRTRVEQLADGVEDFAKDKTREELENTKMNVKLVVV